MFGWETAGEGLLLNALPCNTKFSSDHQTVELRMLMWGMIEAYVVCRSPPQTTRSNIENVLECLRPTDLLLTMRNSNFARCMMARRLPHLV